MIKSAGKFPLLSLIDTLSGQAVRRSLTTEQCPFSAAWLVHACVMYITELEAGLGSLGQGIQHVNKHPEPLSYGIYMHNYALNCLESA